MPVDRKPIFATVKALRNGQAWTQQEVNMLDLAIDKATGEKTPRLYLELPDAPKFSLSKTSLDRLAYARPELRRTVELAIKYSVVDFGVSQTIRSVEQQKAAVASGNSRTMHSKHLKQADGWVWAVDLVAYVEGKVSWAMEHYAAIAFAMDRAATELGLAGHIRWGCAWDRVLSDFGGDANAYMAEVKAYAKRHPGSDLLDGPHFEWVT
jgi:peptidoglycan L-alanyl-D-glutamate endopeptidase CwlK